MCRLHDRVLILTGLGTPGMFRRAVTAGVSGFLVKDAPAQALIDAVRGVAHGERIMDLPLADPAARPGPPPGQSTTETSSP